EIADIFVVNKADRPGADETRRDLDNMLDLGTHTGEWRPPIVVATASTGEGVEQLRQAVSDHQSHLDASGEGELRRRRRLVAELREVVLRRLEIELAGAEGSETFAALGDKVLSGELDPYDAAEQILAAGVDSPGEPAQANDPAKPSPPDARPRLRSPSPPAPRGLHGREAP
ncbi:MAG: hypothetical protein ACR2KC_05730, partial [Acidimicrobiales bacterium]